MYLHVWSVNDGVGGGGGGGPADGPHHPPPPPPAPHHPLHLAVEEAVGEGDDEALGGEDDGLRRVVDGQDRGQVEALHGGADHQGEDVAEAQQGHHEDERLGSLPVATVVVRRRHCLLAQLQDDDLREGS